MHANEYSMAVDEVYNYCRNKLKHGLYDKTGKDVDFEPEVFEYIFNMLEEIQGLVTDAYTLEG
jgi:hypothetical protein